MRKPLTMMLTLILLLSFASPSLGFAQEGGPDPEGPDVGGTTNIFLPMVMASGVSYTLAGQVMDAQDTPLGGVEIADSFGRATTTDENGFYSLEVRPGAIELAASKEGYTFDPLSPNLNVSQDQYNLNFTGLLACSNMVTNPSFETLNHYWNPISGNANGYTPVYSFAQAHTGSVSGFTGIPSGEENLLSWSRWRTHELYIPPGSSSAQLRLFLWPKVDPPPPCCSPEPEMPEVGFDTASPDAPVLAGDFQYIALIDANTNEVLEWLYWSQRNDQAWVQVGPGSLLSWAGTTFKLEFGTYNDGVGNISSAYFDDVTLDVCPAGAPGVNCENILLNSAMEGATNWVIKPSNNPSKYTTQRWWSPVRSMLSGVPVGSVNPFPHVWTTAEFYQPVTIPSDAFYAVVRVRLLPTSSQWWWYGAQSEPPREVDGYDPKALAAAEAQYGFIMNSTGTIDLRNLFKWYSYDSAYWLLREFDVLDFRGQTVSVLFGAGNDGWDGNTALYVDNAKLVVCR